MALGLVHLSACYLSLGTPPCLHLDRLWNLSLRLEVFVLWDFIDRLIACAHTVSTSRVLGTLMFEVTNTSLTIQVEIALCKELGCFTITKWPPPRVRMRRGRLYQLTQGIKLLLTYKVQSCFSYAHLVMLEKKNYEWITKTVWKIFHKGFYICFRFHEGLKTNLLYVISSSRGNFELAPRFVREVDFPL